MLLGYDELNCRSFSVLGPESAAFWTLTDHGIVVLLTWILLSCIIQNSRYSLGIANDGLKYGIHTLQWYIRYNGKTYLYHFSFDAYCSKYPPSCIPAHDDVSYPNKCDSQYCHSPNLCLLPYHHCHINVLAQRVAEANTV